MTILSAYAVNIFQNQPVKIGTNGTLEAAAIGDRFVGTFQGVEFTDSEGRRRVSNRWVASTSATDIVAYATIDPSIVYEIQSSATVALTDIGSQADFTAISAGSSVVGTSQLMLDAATISTSVQSSLRILNVSPGSDNAFGDTYVILQVQIAEHQFVADRAPF